MKRTTIKLPDELDARLRFEAELRGMTISEPTREAIAAHIGGGPVRRLRAAGAGRGDGSRWRRTSTTTCGSVGSGRTPGRRRRSAPCVRRRHGERLGPLAEARFPSDVASGEFTVEPVHAMDWERIAELVARYRDMRLGTVDASVVAAAERLGITAVATLDRRHFSVVRPRHVEAFALPMLE